MKFSLSLPRFRLSRNSRKYAMVLALSVGILTLLMGTLGSRLINSRMVSVVVAANDMSAGQLLKAQDLKLVGKVSGVIPAGFLTSLEQAEGLSLVYPVKAGQPIIQDLISKSPQRNGLYPGEVGVWVGVSLTTAGLVRPGDLVDVFVATGGNSSNNAPPQMISTLQGVRVVEVMNSSAQPIRSGATSSTSNGGVPAAVELAIPKTRSNDFSQIASGKVSLMLDPFATPLTAMEGNLSVGSFGTSTGIPNQVQQPPSQDTVLPTIDTSQDNSQEPNNDLPQQDQTYSPPIYNP